MELSYPAACWLHNGECGMEDQKRVSPLLFHPIPTDSFFFSFSIVFLVLCSHSVDPTAAASSREGAEMRRHRIRRTHASAYCFSFRIHQTQLANAKNGENENENSSFQRRWIVCNFAFSPSPPFFRLNSCARSKGMSWMKLILVSEPQFAIFGRQSSLVTPIVRSLFVTLAPRARTETHICAQSANRKLKLFASLSV